MNVALEKFKNIKSGLEVTIYIDENNGMYYAKSDDISYFTRHYNQKDELYKTLGNDDFQRWDEKEIARTIEKYNKLKKMCKNRECEPPVGGVEDCEFYSEGICTVDIK